jgi:hypothetical protein
MAVPAAGRFSTKCAPGRTVWTPESIPPAIPDVSRNKVSIRLTLQNVSDQIPEGR